MAEGTEQDTIGPSSSPYEFNASAAIERAIGPESEIRGTFGQVEFVDPSASGTASDTGTDAGNTGSGSSDFNPGTSSGPGARTKRKYTRRGTQENKALHLDGWSDAMMAIHSALAGIAKCPELELDEQEAQKVTGALDRLAAFYHVEPSPAVKMWMQVSGAFAQVYGPRMIAIKVRLDREKRDKANPPGPRVVRPFPVA